MSLSDPVPGLDRSPRRRAPRRAAALLPLVAVACALLAGGRLAGAQELRSPLPAAIPANWQPVDTLPLPRGAALRQLNGTPLRFQDTPGWIRTIERITDQGLPMLEVHRGRQSSVVFGIDRKGFIGFFTVARTPLRD
ncbi:MAG: hypothetical protein U1F11_00340 [Steroidobacteraceae bacterium]